MRSLLFLSVVVAALAIPARWARHPDAALGLRRTLLALLAANALYLAYVAWLHPVLFVPHWP